MSPKPDKLIPALYGGVIMALLSTVPFISFINCLCCAGILSGGFFAVFFYKNNFTPDTPPYTSGDCVALGALAGVFGAIFGTILSTIFMILFGNIMREIIIQWLQNMNIDIPGEAWDVIEKSFNFALSPISIILSFMGKLVIDVIFGLLGGLIGYSVYKPKPQVIPPPPPIQPV
jgi:hypothetical protein